MPIFEIQSQSLLPVEQINFSNEKLLQKLVEQNLKPIFNCRFVASEFSTGSQHAGRIDTLALSEDNNPVIIEYKIVESDGLINQSLYYLDWINDHHGDFEVAANKNHENKTEVDWSDIRVICIAPNYKKYDLHAVNQMRVPNIELWQYRLFKNECLYLEKIFPKGDPTSPETKKNLDMTFAGKEAALAQKAGSYSLEQHFIKGSEPIKALALSIQEFIMGLDSAIQEVPKKYYIAYKLSQNIVCMVIQKQRVILYVKLDPKSLSELLPIARDVTTSEHYGTGDLELVLESTSDFETAKTFIFQAYQKIGG